MGNANHRLSTLIFRLALMSVNQCSHPSSCLSLGVNPHRLRILHALPCPMPNDAGKG